MDSIRLSGSFVSEKISKIRWLSDSQGENNRFLTGSWDSLKNHIQIWSLEKNQYSDDENDFIPKSCNKLDFQGDVSGLEIFSETKVVASSTLGFISLIDIDRQTDAIEVAKTSDKIHYFRDKSAPCTAIAVLGNDIASVGEDGRLNILRPTSTKVETVQTIDKADSCSLTAVSILNFNEILVGNRMGVAKMFDVRAKDNKVSETFLISCEDERKSNSVTGICYHPDQKHIILLGSEEGSITVWDLRNPNFPASYLSAHTNSITELAFHKTESTKLFTASENGELWQWNQNVMHIASDDIHRDTENISPWLNGERAKNKINVTSLITGIRKSINSFDSQGSKIICGCDNEAVYFIENMY